MCYIERQNMIPLLIIIGYFYLIWFLVEFIVDANREKIEQTKMYKVFESIWKWLVKIISTSVNSTFSGIQQLLNLFKVNK